jgi:hypothetical protein
MRPSLLERIRAASGAAGMPGIADPERSVARHAEAAILAAVREEPRVDRGGEGSSGATRRRRAESWHQALSTRVEEAVRRGDPRILEVRCECGPSERRHECVVLLDLAYGDPIARRRLRFIVGHHGGPRRDEAFEIDA